MAQDDQNFAGENAAAEAPRSEIHLSEYWAIIVKRRRLVILAMVLVLLATSLRTLLTPPTYRATAIVNIEKDRGTPYDFGDGRQVYQYWEPEYNPTQIRLIQSREMAERAADRLSLMTNSAFNPPASVAFKSAADRQAAAASARLGAALRVQGGLSVVPIRGTNLVELSYEGSEPKLAADVANAVAEAFIDWNTEAKYKVLGSANRFLSTQGEQLKSEIGALEKKLQAYGRANDIISTDPEQNSTIQNLGSLNQDYASAVADRVAKEARYYQMQNSSASSLVESEGTGLITSLQTEQAKLEREYAEKLNLYKPEWPAMQQLKAQIEKGRQHLNTVINDTVGKAREAARNDYLTARRREDTLKGVLQGQKSEAMTMNSNAVEYNNLKVEIDTKRALLDGLMKQQASTEVSSRLRGEQVSNIRIVDRALPPGGRFRPSYKRAVMMGLFLGAAIGFGLAFFLEYLDRSLRTPTQVEQYLRLPALGIIPSVGATGKKGGYGYGYGYGARRKKKQNQGIAAEAQKVNVELIPHMHPRSTVAEAYRAFRAALLLSRAGGLKSIVMTSSLPGEGKTTSAANLAVVLGQINKRVLLIDADLHKPRVHKVFNVSNRVGLVSVLAEGADIFDTIVQTSIANVYVMPAGPNSPNPSGLLSSEAMTDFLAAVQKEFDYVIIDTPPLGPVADAIVIGHSTDGVVLCTQAGRTPRELVRRVRDKLQLSNVRVLGVLINNLQEDAVTYEQYYKYYGGDSVYGAAGYTENIAAKVATKRVS